MAEGLAEWLAEWGGDRKSLPPNNFEKIVTASLPTSRATPFVVTALWRFGEVQGCHREWQGCHDVFPVTADASPCQKRTNFKVATKVAKIWRGGVVRI